MTERDVKGIVFAAWDPKNRPWTRVKGWEHHMLADLINSRIIGFIVITPNKINYERMFPVYACECRSYIRRWLNDCHPHRPNMGDSDAIVCMTEIQ
jgi:hypothetical protein